MSRYLYFKEAYRSISLSVGWDLGQVPTIPICSAWPDLLLLRFFSSAFFQQSFALPLLSLQGRFHWVRLDCR